MEAQTIENPARAERKPANGTAAEPNAREARPEGSPPEVAPPKNGKRPLLILGALLAVVLAGVAGFLVLTAGQVSTDDAQVSADLVPLGARVPGQIVAVSIRENQVVKKGDLIARIDDADYVARVHQSEAELASAEAQSAQAAAQVEIVTATSRGSLSSARAAYSGSSVGVASADAQVGVAKASVARAEADLKKATTDLGRARELRAANAVPAERVDNAEAAFTAAEASVNQARAQLTATEESKRAAVARVSEAAGRVTQSAPIDAQVAAARANAALADARVASGRAALELAKLQLSYTKIVAPSDGVASKLSVHEGQLVNAGQPIVELVPSATYVIANFKETQLDGMRPGQSAKIEIDAYPHRDLTGKIVSISGGTGASFSLLPADNASGNFVKVVQRVPVRIEWSSPPADLALRAGLSANVTVQLEH